MSSTCGPHSLANIDYNPRISHHMPSKVRDGISYPFPNTNDCTVEVWEWISNFIPLYDGCNYAPLLKFKLNHVCKRGSEYMSCAGHCNITLNIHHVESCNNSTCLHYPHWKTTGAWCAFLAQSVWCNCCTEPVYIYFQSILLFPGSKCSLEKTSQRILPSSTNIDFR